MVIVHVKTTPLGEIQPRGEGEQKVLRSQGTGLNTHGQSLSIFWHGIPPNSLAINQQLSILHYVP